MIYEKYIKENIFLDTDIEHAGGAADNNGIKIILEQYIMNYTDEIIDILKGVNE